MRILVTGGLGFIGSHVVTALEREGHEVRVLDVLLEVAHGPAPASRAAGPKERSSLGGEEPGDLVRGDVRDLDTVLAALDGVDAVCHQAAMVGLGVDLDDLPDYVSHNVLGTAVLLRAMARSGGTGRLVLASSMVVYGEGSYRCDRDGVVRPDARSRTALEAGEFEPVCPRCGAAVVSTELDEDAPLDPRNGYAATKVAQEHLAATWARETGGSVVALRYHNVYGPGMPRNTPYAGVASIFRSALERGEAPQVFEDGGQRRDFVHVRDVARANVAALATTAVGPGALRAYNVASGEPHTIGDLAGALATNASGPPPVVTGAFRLGDVRHIVASPRRAADELGFVAAEAFEAGMEEFAHAPLRG